METEFQMIDNYVKSYEFNLKERINIKKGFNINGKLDYNQLEPKENKDGIIVGIELQTTITLTEKENIKNEYGIIKLSMVGVFIFNKNIEKEKMKRLLAINGAAILYQQMRTYIQVNTNLSGLPNIILPVVNFVDACKIKEEKKK